MQKLHENILIPFFKKIHKISLNYLKKYNSYTKLAIPKKTKTPLLILHTGASINNGSITHAEQWIPSLIESKLEFIIVTRNIDTYQQLSKKYKNLSISLITSPKDADLLMSKFPSIKNILYVANTSNNFLFLRYPFRNHIFLGHGDSDKNASMNRYFKVYDEIYTAGQAHIDRFSKADFDTTSMRFHIIGRPISRELLTKKENSDSKNNFQSIIYLPTWEGFYTDQNYSSLHLFHEILLSLSNHRDKNVIVKLHPVTGLVNKNYLHLDERLPLPIKNNKNIKFIDKSENIISALHEKSIYVCDISSVISECILLDCPIFLYYPLDKKIDVASGKISYTDFSYTFSSIEELNSKLKMVLSGHDELAQKRIEARNYLVSIDATENKEFIKKLHKISK